MTDVALWHVLDLGEELIREDGDVRLLQACDISELASTMKCRGSVSGNRVLDATASEHFGYCLGMNADAEVHELVLDRLPTAVLDLRVEPERHMSSAALKSPRPYSEAVTASGVMT